jgi:hypothetical protein
MIETISGALTGLSGALEIAKGINSKITAVEMAEAKSELLERLSTVQIALAEATQEVLSAQERIRTLEAEIVQLKEWDAEAESYELADTGAGALAYLPKGAEGNYKSGHWLCPNCFSERKKSLLIPQNPGPYWMLRCHPCGLEIVTMGRRIEGRGR